MLAKSSVAARISGLAALILLVPLPVIGVIGMEHSLHIAFSLLFLHETSMVLGAKFPFTWRIPTIAAAMVGTRYEGLFAVAVVCLLFLVWDGRPLRCVVLAVAAAIPVAGYAIFSVSHGSYSLPNSLVLKGAYWNYSDPRTLVRWAIQLARQFVRAPFLVPIPIAVLSALHRLHRSAARRSTHNAALATVAGTLILRLLYSRIGWIYRYGPT
jgi:hypothetical protein